MPIGSWPDDQVEELKRLHADGLSSAEVARALNLMFGTTHSRNAVIGKKARLGFSVPIGPRTPRMKSAQDRVLKARIGSRKGEATAAGIVERTQRRKAAHVRPVFACDETGLRVADVVPLHLSLLDLGPRQCRYPYGDSPFTFCGCWTFDGSSWCEPHAALATRPWQDRRDPGKAFPQSAVTSIIPARKVA
jgi:GcrA cell cycle regulator